MKPETSKILFKVLIIFLGAPIAAPRKAVRLEETIAEITLSNLIGMILAAVGILLACCRLDESGTVAALADAGVIEWVDVDGHAHGVLGQALTARNGAEAEARGVVGRHRLLVVSIIVIDQLHALDGIAGLIELLEDVDEIVGDALVAHQLASVFTALGIVVHDGEMTQVGTGDGAILGERATLHVGEDRLIQRVDGKTIALGQTH